MKRFRFRPRTWIVLGVVTVIAAAAAVGSYAYFTSSGTGSAVGYVGSPGPLTVTPVWPSGVYLYPGGPAAVVTLTITNTSTTGSAYVTSVTGQATTTPAGCDNSWFAVSADPINVNLAPGGTASINGYVSLTEEYVPQNACANSNPTITWTAG